MNCQCGSIPRTHAAIMVSVASEPDGSYRVHSFHPDYPCERLYLSIGAFMHSFCEPGVDDKLGTGVL